VTMRSSMVPRLIEVRQSSRLISRQSDELVTRHSSLTQ
jgi:hypothetical protein